MRSRRRFFATLILVTAVVTLGAVEALAQPFDDFTEISLTDGYGTGSGVVGTGHETFSFTVEQERRVVIEVVVTEVMEGTGYEDDDSVLYLMDAEGYVVAQDDDSGEGYASLIDYPGLPAGTYYAAVLTYGNELKYEKDGRVKGFHDKGESRFAFELQVETVTRDPNATPLASLRNVTEMGLIERRAAAAGEAGEAHDAFAFRVSDPGRANIEVVVTRIMEGTEYDDDDSVLYLFDDRGELIAKDDDSGEGYASRLEVDLPYAGRYFAAVTTYGDDVELDDRDHLVGFDDDGGSHFEFQLVVDIE